MGMAQDKKVVVVIGAGPRGVAVLERFSAYSNLKDAQQKIELHLVDKYVHEGGAVWRSSQSDVLLMNTTTSETTLFPDGSTNPQLGPGVGSAKTLYDFLKADGFKPTDYAPRSKHGQYLSYVIEQAKEYANKELLSLNFHETEAVDVQEVNQKQQVKLLDNTLIEADTVIFALGHLPTYPGDRLNELALQAKAHGLAILLPNSPVELDYSIMADAKTIIIEGMGLNFYDVLGSLLDLWQARFLERADGSLEYIRGSKEAKLIVGSRSGNLYRPKPDYAGQFPPSYRTLVLTAELADELSEKTGQLSFERDLKPLIHQEVRLALNHAGFEGDLDAWLERQLYPVEYLKANGITGQLAVVSALSANIADSATIEPFWSLTYRVIMAVRVQVNKIVAAGALSPDSYFNEWLAGGLNTFASWASGPPLIRARQLMALIEAQLVQFTGPNMDSSFNPELNCFEVRSDSLSKPLRADAYIAAHLPGVELENYESQLLKNLLARGEIRPALLKIEAEKGFESTGSIDTTLDFHPIRNDGSFDNARIFLGVPVTLNQPGSAVTATPGQGAPLLINAEIAVVKATGYQRTLESEVE